MTQGFVTIATGNVWYYRLALNLLHSSNQYPFAIICDKENEVTKEFDDVIVMENALCSCVDKVVLPDYLPYDETIFIDADCLVYGDIDNYWDSFPKQRHSAPSAPCIRMIPCVAGLKRTKSGITPIRFASFRSSMAGSTI